MLGIEPPRFLIKSDTPHPITMMCRLLDVPRSTYYEWAGRADTVTATAARRAALAEAVESVFDEYRQTYGCRRIAHVLNTERGMSVSVGTVADIMRERGLVAVQPRAYKTTTVAAKTPNTPRMRSGGTSPPRRQAPGWSETSPTCAPGRAGCTWPP